MEKDYHVSLEQTAKAIGSGGLAVLATPALVAMVENLCFEVLEDSLGVGQTTVGARVELAHLAPSPVGAVITVKAKITEQTTRKIDFDFEAYQGEKIIGKGQHTRVIVDEGQFLENLD